MPAELPPDAFGKMAAVMLRVHARFRERHGLPPLDSPWAFVEYLETLKARSALNDPVILGSPRRGIGGAIEAVRRVLWKILLPVFDRQTEVNRDTLAALQVLRKEAQVAREEQQALAARVAELEAQVARRNGQDR